MKPRFSIVVEPAKLPDVREQRELLDNLKENDLLAFNSEAERMFCEIVCCLLDESPNVTQSIVLQETSFDLNISPVTARRYFIKYTASRAMFEVKNKRVVCKIHLHGKRSTIRIVKKR